MANYVKNKPTLELCRRMIDRKKVQSGKQQLENDENMQCKLQKWFYGSGRLVLSTSNSLAFADEQVDNQ